MALEETDVRVYSHPRSGTHYIAALIAKNFFDRDDYKFLFEKRVHAYPSDSWEPIKRKLNLYIWRNFYDVAQSVWVMKERFNIEAESFEHFITTKYKRIVNTKFYQTKPLEKEVYVDNISEQYSVNVRGGTFNDIHKTPLTNWSTHVMSWTKLSLDREDVLVIRYEDLMESHTQTLKKVSDHLELDKDTFENIEKKIGWYVK